MRETVLMTLGVIFLVLGTIVFFTYSETKVLVEVANVLIIVFVLGLVLLGAGLADFVADKVSS